MTDDHRSVRETYDRIASHFSKTRRHPWPEVEAFLDGRSGTVGLDLGCGNGRHLAPLAARVDRALGVDASRALLAIGRERARDRDVRAEWIHADAIRLPLAKTSVDLAVFVATLHHLPTRSARVTSLNELARVLTPTARALLSVWSVEHDRFDAAEGFDTHLDWTLPSGETVPRFYHVYDRAEFEAELANSRLAVESLRLSSGNYYAVAKPQA